MPAKPAKKVRGRAAEERFHFDSAANTQIAARARTGRTKPKCLARPYLEGNPRRNSGAIERRAEVGTRQRHNACSLELKRSAQKRHLQPGRAFGVAHQSVSNSQRYGVSSARRRNAHRPKSLAPQILNRGEQPW